MSIRFSCSCGRKLKVSDEKIGMKVLCSSCGATLKVPKKSQDEYWQDVPAKSEEAKFDYAATVRAFFVQFVPGAVVLVFIAWGRYYLSSQIISGRGNLPPLGGVTGKVTLNGQPLPNATVRFIPLDDEGRSVRKGASVAMGLTDDNGHYRLIYVKDTTGAPVGKTRVQIEAKDASGRERVLREFNSQSTLMREVKSGSQVMDFDVHGTEATTPSAEAANQVPTPGLACPSVAAGEWPVARNASQPGIGHQACRRSSLFRRRCIARRRDGADRRRQRPASLASTHEVDAGGTVPAGCLPAWEIGTLDPPPRFSWRHWTSLLGPGILLAGSSVGAGEWLFGPAVFAQFGGTFLWLATISIATQAFYNLEVMHYTLYCGEPVFAGFFRLVPGPKFWTAVYLVLCVSHIWPFMAANAAVPLTAAVLGHLPGNGTVSIASHTISEAYLVKLLGYVIFLLAFLPLIFGGKIYNVLERMMTFKLVVVLGFLVTVALFLISPRNAWEVFAGFFRFGQVAIRAETVIAGRHFDVERRAGATLYVIKGTFEDQNPVVTKFGAVDEARQQTTWFDVDRTREAPTAADEERLLAWIRTEVKPDRFLVQSHRDGRPIAISGAIRPDGDWFAERVVTQPGNGPALSQSPADLTGRDAETVAQLVANQGFRRTGLIQYWRQHGTLPRLDWPLLAALSAIAGAGMLSNALFSNYARDKGWGMGAKTGAIPSAIGGHRIALSHVGKVFVVDEGTLANWRGWFRHILRDQVIWITCSFIGMALPCMMSLQFIRNAPVSENRVAALTAEGLSSRFPAYAGFWWVSTLFIGFLVLAPNAVFAGDLIARLWTDLIWIGNAKLKDRPGHSVLRVYYSILTIYCVWGLVALTFMSPLQIAIIGPVLGNVALGFSAFHTLAVNRLLLPKPLRPNLFMQLGLIACGIFFLGITAVMIFAPTV